MDGSADGWDVGRLEGCIDGCRVGRDVGVGGPPPDEPYFTSNKISSKTNGPTRTMLPRWKKNSYSYNILNLQFYPGFPEGQNM